MTHYEVLSLGLLAKIASGINLLLTDRILTGDNRENFPVMVEEWCEQLIAMEKDVIAAIRTAPHS